LGKQKQRSEVKKEALHIRSTETCPIYLNEMENIKDARIWKKMLKNSQLEHN